MGGSTSRLALPFPVGSDATNPPADIQRLANALDAIGVVFSEGLDSARPAAGEHGRFYWATDAANLYYDFGGGWLQLNKSSVSLVQQAGDILIGSGVGAFARLAAGTDHQVLMALAGATNGVQWANVLGLPASLPGATAPARFVGGTPQGPPTSGTFLDGDFLIDQTGEIWTCFQGGSPGKWQPAHAAAIGQPLLLNGSTSPSRYVGGTTSGPPTQGTFYVGDFVVDQTGGVWVCVSSGSPGVWSGLIKHCQFTAYQSVTQLIIAGEWVTLSFDTVSIDTDDGHDPDDPTVYVCPRDGTYNLTGCLALPELVGTAQGLGVRLLFNGNPIVGTVNYTPGNSGGYNIVVTMPATLQMRAGDIVQVQGWHDANHDALCPVDQPDIRCRFNVEQRR